MEEEADQKRKRERRKGKQIEELRYLWDLRDRGGSAKIWGGSGVICSDGRIESGADARKRVQKVPQEVRW